MNNNVMQLELNIEKKMRCINIEILVVNMVLKVKGFKKIKSEKTLFHASLRMGQTNSSLELSKGQLMKPKIFLTTIFLQLINQ
jgi:hypothetical protein